MAFAVRFSEKTSLRDTPYISNVKNSATKGISMCTWYKLSQYPEPYPRSLFQYVIEQRVEGFHVMLHSNPEKLEIHIGGPYALDIPYPTKSKAWTHLCIVWNQGIDLFVSFIQPLYSSI